MGARLSLAKRALKDTTIKKADLATEFDTRQFARDVLLLELLQGASQVAAENEPNATISPILAPIIFSVSTIATTVRMNGIN